MEQRISLERMEEAVSLFGSFDENIRILENEFHVSVVNREEQLIITGEPEDTMLAEKAIEALLRLISRGENVGEQHVRYVIGLCRSGQLDRIDELTRDVVCISAKGRPIKPKTIGQKDYIKTIQACPVTIGVGPAGTGKTYLAVAAAVAASLLPPLLLGHVIDRLTAGLPLTLLAVLLYFGSLALEGVLTSAQESLLVLFGQRMTHALRSEMSRKLSRLPAGTLAEQNPGEVASRFSGDVDTVEALFTSGVISTMRRS